MKYFILLLLAVALLWIASVAWSNRRKSTYGGNGSDGSSVGDSCDTFFSPAMKTPSIAKFTFIF